METEKNFKWEYIISEGKWKVCCRVEGGDDQGMLFICIWREHKKANINFKKEGREGWLKENNRGGELASMEFSHETPLYY
jgi:hypothetical protein